MNLQIFVRGCRLKCTSSLLIWSLITVSILLMIVGFTHSRAVVIGMDTMAWHIRHINSFVILFIVFASTALLLSQVHW